MVLESSITVSKAAKKLWQHFSCEVEGVGPQEVAEGKEQNG